MAGFGYFAIIARVLGSGYPVSYLKGLECVLWTYLGSYQLCKRDMLWL